MKLTLYSIGKVKEANIRALVEEYCSRISRYLTFEHIVIKNEDQLLKKLDPHTHVVLCDERGKEHTSEGLAGYIQKHRDGGVKHLAFVIADAPGATEQLKKRATTTLSLSRMTFTHELALLVVSEQLYRAMTILKGEPYHYG